MASNAGMLSRRLAGRSSRRFPPNSLFNRDGSDNTDGHMSFRFAASVVGDTASRIVNMDARDCSVIYLIRLSEEI